MSVSIATEELLVPTWLKSAMNQSWNPQQGWYKEDGGRNQYGVSKHAMDVDSEGPQTILDALELSKHANGIVHPIAGIYGNPGFMLTPEWNINNSATWGTPQALNGLPSPTLGETVSIIGTAQEEKIWAELVPIRDIRDDSADIVHWTVIEHRPAIARETTPLGLPTMVEACATSGKAELRQFKLAGQIGIGFWKTAHGTDHFNAVLVSIANGIVAAGQFSAAVTLANAEQVYLRRNFMSPKFRKPDIDEVYNRRALTFASLQRRPSNRLQTLKIAAEQMISAKEGMPGKYSMVLSPETVVALMKLNDNNTNFYLAGPTGPEKLTDTIMTKMVVDNVELILMPGFRMPQYRIVQTLSHPDEIGEYILAFDETPSTVKDEDYNPRSRDRMIYTQERKWMEVTFEDMISNLPIWDKDGNVQKPSGFKPEPLSNGGKFNPNFPLDENGSVAKLPNNVTFTKAGLLAAHRGGKRVPINIIILQPHQRMMVHDGLWMSPGNVAYRVRKPGAAVIGDDVAHHIHQISAAAKMGCALQFEKNIAVLPSVFVKETGSGFGIKPIMPENYKPRNYGLVGDAIYIAVPDTFKRNDVPVNLNMLGVITPELAKYYAYTIDPLHNAYPGYAYYSKLFGFSESQAMLGMPNKRSWTDGFREIDDPVNFVCRQAVYRLFDTQTGKYSIFRSGNGYWREDGTYESANEDRKGGVFAAHIDTRQFE